MDSMENIVNELVEKRIKEKLDSFLLKDKANDEYRYSSYNDMINDKLGEKLADIITLYIEHHKEALEIRVKEVIAEKINEFGKNKLEVHFSMVRY